MEDKKSVFNDVPTTDKYYKIYKWCWQNKLLNRDSKGNFNPSKKMNKKHIAIIIYRLYNFIKKNWGLT